MSAVCVSRGGAEARRKFNLTPGQRQTLQEQSLLETDNRVEEANFLVAQRGHALGLLLSP